MSACSLDLPIDGWQVMSADPGEREALRAEVAELNRRLALLERRLGGRAAPELPRGTFPALLCRAGADRIALPLAAIREVVPMVLLSAIPEAPPWVAGLLNLRGLAVPALDVAARLARGAARAEADDLVVVAQGEPGAVGLVVQEVLGVIELDGRDVAGPAAELSAAPYLGGAVHRDGATVVVLDVAALVDSSDLPSAA